MKRAHHPDQPSAAQFTDSGPTRFWRAARYGVFFLPAVAFGVLYLIYGEHDHGRLLLLRGLGWAFVGAVALILALQFRVRTLSAPVIALLMAVGGLMLSLGITPFLRRHPPSSVDSFRSREVIDAANVLRPRLARLWHDAKYDLTRAPDVEASVINNEPEFISSVRVVVDGPNAATVYFRNSGRVYRFVVEDVGTGRTRWLEPLEGLEFPAHLPEQH